MNSEDAIRTRKRRNKWPENFKCVDCGESPTCPMLQDELWATIKPDISNAPCLCGREMEAHWEEETRVRNLFDDCKYYRPSKKDLLCFECTEKRMGREITVDDLLPCGGNYATYVMMTRNTSQTAADAERELTAAGVDVPAFCDECDPSFGCWLDGGKCSKRPMPIQRPLMFEGRQVGWIEPSGTMIIHDEATVKTLGEGKRGIDGAAEIPPNREPVPCSGECDYGEEGDMPRDLGPDGKPLSGDDPTLECINCGWLLGDLPKEQV